ncbi:MAG: hypothetical protein ACHQ53_04690, partial [Polyangiales bacterium]
MFVLRCLAVLAAIAFGCSSSKGSVAKSPAKGTRSGAGVSSAASKDASAAHDTGTAADAGKTTSIALLDAMPGIGFDDL